MRLLCQIVHTVDHDLIHRHKDIQLYLICPLTSGRFFVRFMLESKGTSKYCGDRNTSVLMQADAHKHINLLP